MKFLEKRIEFGFLYWIFVFVKKYLNEHIVMIAWSLLFGTLLLVWNINGLFFENSLTELVSGLAFEIANVFSNEDVHLSSQWKTTDGASCNIWSIWSSKFQVNISAGCNGLAILLLYFWFVLIQGGYSAWRKLKYVVFGFAVLTLSNSLRLVALFYLSVIPAFWFEIVHKWVFQGIMYILMFGLWYLFLKEKKRI